MTDLNALRDEFAAAFEAGESPDVDELLGRVSGDERQELEGLIDQYLMTAPRRTWDAKAFESSLTKVALDRVVESRDGISGNWPALLPRLRMRAKLKRADLVQRLAELLGVGTSKADLEKVGDYYNQMEHGRLRADGVSSRVVDALADLLDSTSQAIRSAGLGITDPDDVAPAIYARLADADPAYEMKHVADEVIPMAAGQASPAEPASPGTRDRIDELFTGG